jgi:hypothetical protein
MKLKQATIGFIIICAFLLLLCDGCTSRQVKVDINYAPTGTSLLGDLKPSVISLQVVDWRPEEQRNNIGVQRYTWSGTEHAAIVSKTHEVQVVYNALKAELEKSGHLVLNNTGQGHGEVTVIVWLTQFLIDSKIESDDIELVGSIRADVVASASTRNVPQVSFKVECSYRYFVKMALWYSGLFSATPESHIEKTLNGTLAEFVRRFCLEPKLHQVFI